MGEGTGKNCNIALTQYKHVAGILYNGKNVRVFLDNIEAESTAPTLQDKSYYLTIFTKNTIDEQQIYSLTKRINDCLHIDFGNMPYRVIRVYVNHKSGVHSLRWGIFYKKDICFRHGAPH